MDNSVFELCFPSEIYLTKKVINDILLFIEGRVTRFSDAIKNDVRLIFQELLVNSIVHGNRNDIGKKVYVRVEILDGTIMAKITDEGKGFDYARLLSEFDKRDKLIFDHGRGIQLACSLSDSYFFNSCGNEINISKKVTKDEQGDGN